MFGCFVTLNADIGHLSLLHELLMVAIDMLLRILLLYSEYFSCHFAGFEYIRTLSAMVQTHLQHSSDVFEVYILVTVGKCYSPTYNSKLFSFVCCLPSVLL